MNRSATPILAACIKLMNDETVIFVMTVTSSRWPNRRAFSPRSLEQLASVDGNGIHDVRGASIFCWKAGLDT